MRSNATWVAGFTALAGAAGATVSAVTTLGSAKSSDFDLFGSEPHASVAAAPNGLPLHFEPPVGSPAGTIYLPNLGYELSPLPGGVPQGSLVASSDAALSLIKLHGGMPESANVISAQPNVAFGSFTDTTSGVPQAGGSLRLSDAAEAAWLFTWPLAKPEQGPQGGPRLPGSGATPRASVSVYAPGDCVWFVVVKTAGDSPRQGQTCTHDPGIPAVMTVER